LEKRFVVAAGTGAVLVHARRCNHRNAPSLGLNWEVRMSARAS
jgi:hypothetical protein